MGLKPGSNELSFMHFQVVHHEIDASLGGRKSLLQLREKCDEFHLPLAGGGASVDLACTGIKSRPPGVMLPSVCTRVPSVSANLVAMGVSEPNGDAVEDWFSHPCTRRVHPWSRGACINQPGS